MKEVNFSVSKKDALVIGRLAYRALALDVNANGADARKIMDWQMDLTAAHANGCPLNLAKLEATDDFNFAHDAFGIARHLNRSTGEIENHFSPRCSA